MNAGISLTAFHKLSTLRRDFLSLTDEERLAFTITLRSRRIKPPPKESRIKAVKELKPPSAKTPRKKKASPGPCALSTSDSPPSTDQPNSPGGSTPT